MQSSVAAILGSVLGILLFLVPTILPNNSPIALSQKYVGFLEMRILHGTVLSHDKPGRELVIRMEDASEPEMQATAKVYYTKRTFWSEVTLLSKSGYFYGIDTLTEASPANLEIGDIVYLQRDAKVTNNLLVDNAIIFKHKF